MSFVAYLWFYRWEAENKMYKLHCCEEARIDFFWIGPWHSGNLNLAYRRKNGSPEKAIKLVPLPPHPHIMVVMEKGIWEVASDWALSVWLLLSFFSVAPSFCSTKNLGKWGSCEPFQSKLWRGSKELYIFSTRSHGLTVTQWNFRPFFSFEQLTCITRILRVPSISKAVWCTAEGELKKSKKSEQSRVYRANFCAFCPMFFTPAHWL